MLKEMEFFASEIILQKLFSYKYISLFWKTCKRAKGTLMLPAISMHEESSIPCLMKLCFLKVRDAVFRLIFPAVNQQAAGCSLCRDWLHAFAYAASAAPTT